MTDKDHQTEEKIFEAATIVFEEEGLTGARMQKIADMAGINKSLLHYYFRTKDLLFEAVFTKLATKMFAKFTPIFEEELSLEEKIRFFFEEHINFLKQNPRLPGFILNEINRNPQRIKKMISYVDFKGIWTNIFELHAKELEEYNINEDNFPQIMTTIASLTIFPFAARGIFEVIFDKIDLSFDQYIEERKKFAADFVLKGISN